MLIKSTTLSEAWEKSIEYLLRMKQNGEELIPTERGDLALEATNVLLKIEKPMAGNRISPKYPHERYSEDYSMHLFDQGYNQQVYSRITNIIIGNTDAINQSEELVSKLKNEWFSRRAVISLWNPFEDIHSAHPPCICLLQFIIRNKQLCLTSTYRSNDAWLCAPSDMIAITNLQKNIADKLGFSVGYYAHFAVSYHIYASDLPMALSIFNKYE